MIEISGEVERKFQFDSFDVLSSLSLMLLIDETLMS